MRKHPLLAFAASTLGLSFGASLFGAYSATATPKIVRPHISIRGANTQLHAHHWSINRWTKGSPTQIGLALESAPTNFVLPSSVSAQLVPPTPDSDRVWTELRNCESHDNYQENSGNGFYGAYQFTIGSWHSVGEVGMPNAAPPAVQDAAARRLLAIQGWGAWPQCTWALGLA